MDSPDEWRPAGALIVAGLALLLLLLTLFSAWTVISGASSEFLITTLAALVLPSILVATVLTGAALGVVAIGRFADPARVWSRVLYGALGGLPLRRKAAERATAAHSSVSTSIGEIRAARSEGRRQAARETAPRTPAVAASVAGWRAGTL